jgi:hypothetical protein
MVEAQILSVGDAVRVFGGYDSRPGWLAGSSGYTGTVVAFIPGQNEQEAAVVRLDERLVLPRAQGDHVVLELGACGSYLGHPAAANPRRVV